MLRNIHEWVYSYEAFQLSVMIVLAFIGIMILISTVGWLRNRFKRRNKDD